MTVTIKGDSTHIAGRTVTVTDSMGDKFVITRYNDHALCMSVSGQDAEIRRVGPVVKLGPAAMKAIAEMLQEGVW